MKYFCWERNFASSWIPIFYTEKPMKKIGDQIVRSPIYEVSDSISFDRAAELHPAPTEEVTK